MSRYDIHSDEGEFQPGSNGLVLRNLLDITLPGDMDELELELLAQLYKAVLLDLLHLPDRRITVQDIKTWHRQWLGNVYSWVGGPRALGEHGQGRLHACRCPADPLLARDL
ncbi:hypothetical protein [Roseateles sp. LYH14W]|uniref:Cell filamentation protein Fic n=1 Tax=Pelomonas parva TaxID=3299032 RepID=A0ABW7F831_9BURK